MQPPNSEAPASDQASETGAGITGEQPNGSTPGETRNPRQKEGRAFGVIEGGKPTIRNLLDLPSVKLWASTQGLTEASFNAVWGEENDAHGYPRPKGRATFTKDGVTVTGSIEPPSPEHERVMLAEIEAAKFPKQRTLAAIAEPPSGVSLSDKNVFVCHDFDGQVVMIHQRYENRDASKGFLNWTFWDDGEWRNILPEVMPFYGLPGHEDKVTLFIHEGAKAARRVKAIIAGEEDGRFPWREEMRLGHHIGWLGGVHAVNRSDWRRLAALGWKRVVIVADNDDPGIRGASQITRHFRCPTYMLRFDGSFREGFDCGDDWPESEFDELGRHTGRTFLECLQPADYATDLVTLTTDSGRPKTVPVLRSNFVSRYRVAVDTQQVFCIDRAALAMGKDRFNDEMRQRSDATNTYGELIKHPEAVCARRVFNPSAPPGPVIDDGEVCWNAYEPSRVQPIAGDCGPFLDFMAHLIPFEEDREPSLDWIATLIARRDVRMHYSLLLISKRQGVGKSTLGRILKRNLGPSNVSFPGERSIADSAFNGWALGKLLIFVDEIYSNGNSKVYDKLKPYVTDTEIPINEKHVKEFWVQNWAVFIACSNSKKALFIPDDDRRWLIPTVTEELQDRAWWERFNAWLDADGIGIILHWAKERAAKRWVRTGDRAPDTTAKRAIIRENKSEGRLLARDFGEEFAGMERAVVKISDLRAWIAHRRRIDLGHANLEKERLIIDELEGIDGLYIWKGDQRPKIGGRRGSKETVVFNFNPGVVKWGEVEGLLRTMEQIGFGDAM